MSPPPPSPTRRRGLRGWQVLLGMVAIIAVVMPAIALPSFLARSDAPNLDDFGELPEFSLVDHTGATVTAADLHGHVTVANFIFTRCDTICPTLSMKMQKVQESTFDHRDAIKLLSISVDPGHDTPEVLRGYADRFRADPTRWRFVTGDQAEIQRTVEQGFLTGIDPMGVRPSGTPDIRHSGHLVLIDRRGHLRGFYDSNDVLRLDRLMRDARYLARQK